jgi:hypothetical protein
MLSYIRLRKVISSACSGRCSAAGNVESPRVETPGEFLVTVGGGEVASEPLLAESDSQLSDVGGWPLPGL